MKKPITEINAVAAIVDSIFQQIDDHWAKIWEPVNESLQQILATAPSPDFVKFNYSLAALSINIRSSFDLFPRPQAERLFTMVQNLLLKQLGSGDGFKAVQNSIGKYIEAYNNGILNIRNPLHDVATLLYYKIGLKNTELTIADESYYVPEPKIVDYLSNSLLLFAGKWDSLLQRFEIQPAGGHPRKDASASPGEQ